MDGVDRAGLVAVVEVGGDACACADYDQAKLSIAHPFLGRDACTWAGTWAAHGGRRDERKASLPCQREAGGPEEASRARK